MRFFTKEWYYDSVTSEMCFQLRKTQKASVMSDKYFEKLYLLEKKAFLKYSKRMAKYSREKFDLAAAERKFDVNFNENLEYVKTNLPDDILNRVADIRVLALGSADYDTADAITRFCGQLNRKCEKIRSNYNDACERVAEALGWFLVNSLDKLIGAPVKTIDILEGVVTVTTSHEFTGVACKVTLSGAQIVENDALAVGAAVVQHELYLDENESGRLFFGLLCLTENGDAVTVTICADNIEIEEI